MIGRLFHVFRNTPLGRETYLQSLYFCNQSGLSLKVYVPLETRFLMYLEHHVVQVDLDNSYLTSPENAQDHARDLADEAGVKIEFFEPTDYTASTLPEVSVNFQYMCCPRSISDLSSKIGLGYIGPRVRVIVHEARFPVLVPSPVFKEWHSLAVFFGGSANAFDALKHALALHRTTGMPLDLFTIEEGGRDQAHLENRLKDEGLAEEVHGCLRDWHVKKGGTLAKHLYDVPHDALAIVGAYGHGLIKELVFGSKMEAIQANLCNNLLIVGPRCHLPH
ncbi:MAG: universal stress protein [Acidobacteria bacterium]|nr:MAG: universal stress protein [Acidobacteriota bacterium]